MSSLDDNKRLFFDMQEHPEKYSDEQLETMMDDLDREVKSDEVWKLFEGKTNIPKKTLLFRQKLTRIAAAFIFAAFLGGLAFAGWYMIQGADEKTDCDTVATKEQMVESVTMVDGLILFADVRLDSMLAVVGEYYGKAVCFGDEQLRRLRIHTKWNNKDSLSAFIENLNELDVLKLTEQRDTIFVQKGGEQ